MKQTLPKVFKLPFHIKCHQIFEEKEPLLLILILNLSQNMKNMPLGRALELFVCEFLSQWPGFCSLFA